MWFIVLFCFMAFSRLLSSTDSHDKEILETLV